ncbi:hydroxyacylglutathione hydrolase [Acetobacter orientalis]|uniref:hydroxyacylglutathione hydrolase n=1 Tax=Acetobacter orientalis TaxID=146474 RepID=UPI0039E8CD02
MPISIRAIPALSDNYIWLLQDQKTGLVAVIDPGEAAPVEAALNAANLKLSLILLTHHHADHTGGALALAHHYNAHIAGPAGEQHRLPPLDTTLHDGQSITLGQSMAQVIAVPGHTAGHIAYYFDAPRALFCGDTLFSLGCGRLFEGTPAQMFASLHRFDTLPDDTLVCCAHEYTQSNAAFASQIDPTNTALQARAQEVAALRAAGKPTLPSTLGLERATNPFLRAPDVETFAKIRAQKDQF